MEAKVYKSKKGNGLDLELNSENGLLVKIYMTKQASKELRDLIDVKIS